MSQWAEITGTDRKNADYECRYMYEKGWMTRIKDDKSFVYALRIRPADDGSGETQARAILPDQGVVSSEHEAVGGIPSSQTDFDFWMKQLDASKSENRRMIAITIRSMKSQGITGFNRNEWMEMSGMDRVRTRDACDYMVSHRHRQDHYHLCDYSLKNLIIVMPARSTLCYNTFTNV